MRRVAPTLFLFAICGAALAHSGATGVVEQRMNAMKEMAADMKTTGAMLRGGAPYDAQAAAAAAARLSAHAAHMPMLFPDGSFNHPSEARGVIATEREAFNELAAALGAAAARMESAAAADDLQTLGKARRDAGRTCSGCHLGYRQKQRH